MAYNFEIPFEGGDAAQILDKARQAIESNRGSLSGDDTVGSFSLPAGLSKIKGSYVVEDNKLKITITNKPIYVSNDMIEGVLKKHIS